MGTTAKANAGGAMVFDDSPLAPAGNHIGICVWVVDVGTQFKKGVPGVYEDKWAYQVLLTWELCGTDVGDGRPYAVSRRLTLSLHEKAELRKLLQSWRGRAFTADELDGFDVKKVLGVPALVNVIHEPARQGDRVYARVTGVTPVPAQFRAAVPRPVNPLVYYAIEDGEPPASLPEWVRNLVKQSQEHGGGRANGQTSRQQQQRPSRQTFPPDVRSGPRQQQFDEVYGSRSHPSPARPAAPNVGQLADDLADCNWPTPAGHLADALARDIQKGSVQVPAQHDVISVGDLGNYCRDAQESLGIDIWRAVYDWAMVQRYPIEPAQWTVDQVDAAYRTAKRRVETAIPERPAAPAPVAAPPWSEPVAAEAPAF